MFKVSSFDLLELCQLTLSHLHVRKFHSEQIFMKFIMGGPN